MLLDILMQYSCIISHQLSLLERRFHDIQIVIIKNLVAVSSGVGIKRVDCIFWLGLFPLHHISVFCFVLLPLFWIHLLSVCFVLSFQTLPAVCFILFLIFRIYLLSDMVCFLFRIYLFSVSFCSLFSESTCFPFCFVLSFQNMYAFCFVVFQLFRICQLSVLLYSLFSEYVRFLFSEYACVLFCFISCFQNMPAFSFFVFPLFRIRPAYRFALFSLFKIHLLSVLVCSIFSDSVCYLCIVFPHFRIYVLSDVSFQNPSAFCSVV